jgi:hypothetical protein
MAAVVKLGQTKAVKECLLIEDETMLCDIACIDPLPAHGLLGLVNLGDTFLLCLYRWRPTKVENGVVQREKTVTTTIMLPRRRRPLAAFSICG